MEHACKPLCIKRIHGWLLRNNELQFAGTYGETGVRYSLSLPADNMQARSRQVLDCILPQKHLEHPSWTQQGAILHATLLHLSNAQGKNIDIM